MAQVHSIDGTTVNYISQAIWSQLSNNQSLNIIAVHNRYRRHTWNSNVMTATEFATLISKRGSIVTIVTTDPDDPNNANYVTYYDAIVKSVTHRAHDSLNFIGVRVDFLVRV
jgi:hypothetical protein